MSVNSSRTNQDALIALMDTILQLRLLIIAPNAKRVIRPPHRPPQLTLREGRLHAKFVLRVIFPLILAARVQVAIKAGTVQLVQRFAPCVPLERSQKQMLVKIVQAAILIFIQTWRPQNVIGVFQATITHSEEPAKSARVDPFVLRMVNRTRRTSSYFLDIGE